MLTSPDRKHMDFFKHALEIRSSIRNLIILSDKEEGRRKKGGEGGMALETDLGDGSWGKGKDFRPRTLKLKLERSGDYRF